eukprot:96907-Pyramimonas_sp.AAC.3
MKTYVRFEIKRSPYMDQSRLRAVRVVVQSFSSGMRWVGGGPDGVASWKSRMRVAVRALAALASSSSFAM